MRVRLCMWGSQLSVFSPSQLPQTGSSAKQTEQGTEIHGASGSWDLGMGNCLTQKDVKVWKTNPEGISVIS